MRCDGCGCNIPDGEEIKTTRTDSQGTAPIFTTHSTNVDYLCRRCHGEMSGFWDILIWVFFAIVALGLFLLVLDWFR